MILASTLAVDECPSRLLPLHRLIPGGQHFLLPLKGSGSEISVLSRKILCGDQEQNPSMDCSTEFQLLPCIATEYHKNSKNCLPFSDLGAHLSEIELGKAWLSPLQQGHAICPLFVTRKPTQKDSRVLTVN